MYTHAPFMGFYEELPYYYFESDWRVIHNHGFPRDPGAVSKTTSSKGATRQPGRTAAKSTHPTSSSAVKKSSEKKSIPATLKRLMIKENRLIEKCRRRFQTDHGHLATLSEPRKRGVVVYSYQKENRTQLTIKEGQQIKQLCSVGLDGFAYGVCKKGFLKRARRGYYPAGNVRLLE